MIKWVILLCIPVLVYSRRQRIVIEGQLMCGDKPYEGADVKLIDKDIGIDDLMSEMKTKRDGNFRLDGTTDEMTDIDPQLKIYHDCDDGIKPGQRRWVFIIPSQYINDPSNNNPKVLKAGTFNLELRQDDEERNFIG